MSKNARRKALGKGIYSLLPSRPAPPASPSQSPTQAPPDAAQAGDIQNLPLEQVRPNPNQPRRQFNAEALMELTQSIERDGIIQPLLARKAGDSEYEIIAGERRWRAAKAAGLKQIPVIVREATDEQVLELAIIENVQREDLNPVELAMAFHRMATELGLSHEQIGQKTGKQRVTITNSLRLLHLPPELQQLVATGKLSAGHARALLKYEDAQIQQDIAQRCVSEGWSVRQIEEFTRPAQTIGGGKSRGAERQEKTKPDPPPVDPNVKFAIDEMERTLGTRVRIIPMGEKKGRLEIEFYSEDDLNRIYETIVLTGR